MIKLSKDTDKKQLIEIHNRPYLVEQIAKGNEFLLTLFFHNDPQTMKGSKSIKGRENILEKCAKQFFVLVSILKKIFRTNYFKKILKKFMFYITE